MDVQRPYVIYMWCLLGMAWLPSAGADLIFSAPPREKATEANKTFEPFVKFLSEILEEKVVYEQPGGWLEYSVNMRHGKYDILFDGPHFAAWRIRHLKHTPIARLPGTLDFFVITKADNKSPKQLHDLATRAITCSLPPPNLGTMIFLAQYTNPVIQPELYEIRRVSDIYQKFVAGNFCTAAVLRDNIYKKLPAEEQKKLTVIFKSPSMPNQTVTMGPRVSEEKRNRLIAALTSQEGAKASEYIFSEFSKNAMKFLPAKAADYASLEFLLEGVVFGW